MMEKMRSLYIAQDFLDCTLLYPKYCNLYDLLDQSYLWDYSAYSYSDSGFADLLDRVQWSQE